MDDFLIEVKELTEFITNLSPIPAINSFSLFIVRVLSRGSLSAKTFSAFCYPCFFALILNSNKVEIFSSLIFFDNLVLGVALSGVGHGLLSTLPFGVEMSGACCFFVINFIGVFVCGDFSEEDFCILSDFSLADNLFKYL